VDGNVELKMKIDVMAILQELTRFPNPPFLGFADAANWADFRKTRIYSGVS